VNVGPALAADTTELYPLASKQFRKATNSDQIADRWEVMRAEAGSESKAATMVYVQRTPPRFIIAPGLLPLEIHPADIRFGYRAMGVVANMVGSKIAIRAFSREYAGSELSVDPDGFVRLAFTVHDMAGNEAPVNLALKVTDKAVRRGDNLDFSRRRSAASAVTTRCMTMCARNLATWPRSRRARPIATMPVPVRQTYADAGVEPKIHETASPDSRSWYCGRTANHRTQQPSAD